MPSNPKPKYTILYVPVSTRRAAVPDEMIAAKPIPRSISAGFFESASNLAWGGRVGSK